VLELFIANKNYSSWSLRPWLLLTELAIPFTERLVPFARGSSWSTFRSFSPTGRVPCLRDTPADDGPPIVVWDSLAIVEYLAESVPAVWPGDLRGRAWARAAAAEMHSGFGALRASCSMTVGQRVRLRAPSEALGRDVARLDELWQDGLARWGGPLLAGDRFTAVDAFFAPVAFRWQTYGFALGEAAAAYARRLLARPSMQAWTAAALAERWRDEAHEVEIAAAGAITADLRAPAPAGD
jgi:glutathione S-transferase